MTGNFTWPVPGSHLVWINSEEVKQCINDAMKGGDMTLVVQLKSFVVDRIDLEEAIALAEQGKLLAAGYESRSIPVPEWLTEKLGVLETEISSKRRDALIKALKQAEGRREALKTEAQKRQDTERQIADLKQLLGQ